MRHILTSIKNTWLLLRIREFYYDFRTVISFLLRTYLKTQLIFYLDSLYCKDLIIFILIKICNCDIKLYLLTFDNFIIIILLNFFWIYFNKKFHQQFEFIKKWFEQLNSFNITLLNELAINFYCFSNYFIFQAFTIFFLKFV